MTDYIYAFILTAVAAVVVEMLSPAGEGGRLGGAVRLVAGLCMLVMLLTPLQEGISLIRALAEGELQFSWNEEITVDENRYNDILQEELSGLGREEVSAWVTATLKSRFGIPADHHTVTVTMADAEGGDLPAIDRITIVLHGSSIFENPHQIEDYFADQLGCLCTVAIQ